MTFGTPCAKVMQQAWGHERFSNCHFYRHTRDFLHQWQKIAMSIFHVHLWGKKPLPHNSPKQLKSLCSTLGQNLLLQEPNPRFSKMTHNHWKMHEMVLNTPKWDFKRWNVSKKSVFSVKFGFIFFQFHWSSKKAADLVQSKICQLS